MSDRRDRPRKDKDRERGDPDSASIRRKSRRDSPSQDTTRSGPIIMESNPPSDKMRPQYASPSTFLRQRGENASYYNNSPSLNPVTLPVGAVEGVTLYGEQPLPPPGPPGVPLTTPFPQRPQRLSMDSSSSSSSYIDISRTFPLKRARGMGAIRTFFSTPSEHRRGLRRRKSTRMLSFGGRNSSSSSVNSDLAYGTGFVKKRKGERRRRSVDVDAGRRESYRREEKGKGRRTDVNSDAAILAVGAGLAAMAKRQNTLDLAEGKRAGIFLPRRTDSGRLREQESSRGIGSSKIHEADEDGWYSDDGDSDDSVDSRLAYGGSTTNIFGNKPHRPGLPQRKSSVVDPKMFGPQNSLLGVVTKPVGFDEIDHGNLSDNPPPTVAQAVKIARQESRPTDSVVSGTSSMKNVFPVPTSDPNRFDAVSSDRFSSRDRPEPVPLQHPKPVTPISQSVYDPAYASSGPSRHRKSPSLAGAALAGVAGAAFGAAMADRKGGRRPEDDRNPYDDDRRRDDRHERRDTRDEIDKRHSRQRDSRDEPIVHQEDRRTDYDRKDRYETEEERRERRRAEDRYKGREDDRDDKRYSTRSEENDGKRPSPIKTAVDPFQYQVDKDAFPTPDAAKGLDSNFPPINRAPSPAIFTIERVPHFAKQASSSKADDRSIPERPRESRETRERQRTEKEARDVYEEAEHFTAPIAVGAVAAAIAAEKVSERRGSRDEKGRRRRRGEDRRDDDGDDSDPRRREKRRSKSDSPEHDEIQAEADRIYREAILARKIASETTDKNRDIKITTPPEMDHKPPPSKYDAPNADFVMDHIMDPTGFKEGITPIVEPSEYPLLPKNAVMVEDDDVKAHRRPFMTLVMPTPTPSPAPEKQEKSRSESKKFEPVQSKEVAKDSTETQTPANSTRSVTWGENETKHYEVESPHEHRDEFIEDQAKSSPPKPIISKDDSKPKKPSRWGSVRGALMGAGAAAGVAAAHTLIDTAEADKDSKSEERQPKSSKEQSKSKDAEKGMPYEYRGVIVEPELSDEEKAGRPPAVGPKPPSPQPRSPIEASKPSTSTMPGSFGDDLDFTATVAAGLQDSGFDPNIVIDDPKYRRRTSPPGTNDDMKGLYKQPYAETVSDLGHFPDKAEKDKYNSERETRRSVLDDAEPVESSRSIGVDPADEFTTKLTKKEQRQRDKEAKRQSTGDYTDIEVIEESPGVALVEEPESYIETSKSKKDKRSKKSKKSYDDDFEEPDEKRVSVPIEQYGDLLENNRELEVAADEWDTPSSKKSKKSKRDSETFDSPTRSLSNSEILDDASSKRSKDKSKRKSEQYELEVDPADIGLPASEISTRSDESRKSRKSSSKRDSSIIEERDGRSESTEPRKSKKSSNRDSSIPDDRSVTSSRYDNDDDQKSSKKKDKEKKNGFFGLFGSSTSKSEPEQPPDDFEEPKKRKKSKRSSTGDSETFIDANGKDRYDDDESVVSRKSANGDGKRAVDEERSSKDEEHSFLARAGTLGAGVGIAGAAALAARHMQSKADDAGASTKPTLAPLDVFQYQVDDDAFSSPDLSNYKDPFTKFERTADGTYVRTDVPGLEEEEEAEEAKEEEPTPVEEDIIDPEISERQFRPSIDPQYGDLLPLPPSNPGTPEDDQPLPLTDLPTLPESRPNSPPRLEQFTPRDRSSTIKRSEHSTPMKSPSASAVPLKFMLGNRSQPSSPRVAVPGQSPVGSPAVASPESMALPTRPRPRPTSWDSSKEYQPLLLLDPSRKRESVDLGRQPAIAGSEETVDRSAPEDSAEEGGESREAESVSVKKPVSKDVAHHSGSTTAALLAGSAIGLGAGAVISSLTGDKKTHDENTSTDHSKDMPEPSPIEPGTKDRSSYLFQSTPPTKRFGSIDTPIEEPESQRASSPSPDDFFDANTTPSKSIAHGSEAVPLGNTESARAALEAVEHGTSVADFALPEGDIRESESTGRAEDALEDPVDDFAVPKSKKGKKGKRKQTIDDIIAEDEAREAETAVASPIETSREIDSVQDFSTPKSKKDKKKDKGKARFDDILDTEEVEWAPAVAKEEARKVEPIEEFEVSKSKKDKKKDKKKKQTFDDVLAEEEIEAPSSPVVAETRDVEPVDEFETLKSKKDKKKDKKKKQTFDDILAEEQIDASSSPTVEDTRETDPIDEFEAPKSKKDKKKDKKKKQIFDDVLAEKEIETPSSPAIQESRDFEPLDVEFEAPKSKKDKKKDKRRKQTFDDVLAEEEVESPSSPIIVESTEAAVVDKKKQTFDDLIADEEPPTPLVSKNVSREVEPEPEASENFSKPRSKEDKKNQTKLATGILAGAGAAAVTGALIHEFSSKKEDDEPEHDRAEPRAGESHDQTRSRSPSKAAVIEQSAPIVDPEESLQSHHSEETVETSRLPENEPLSSNTVLPITEDRNTEKEPEAGIDPEFEYSMPKSKKDKKKAKRASKGQFEEPDSLSSSGVLPAAEEASLPVDPAESLAKEETPVIRDTEAQDDFSSPSSKKNKKDKKKKRLSAWEDEPEPAVDAATPTTFVENTSSNVKSLEEPAVLPSNERELTPQGMGDQEFTKTQEEDIVDEATSNDIPATAVDAEAEELGFTKSKKDKKKDKKNRKSLSRSATQDDFDIGEASVTKNIDEEAAVLPSENLPAISGEPSAVVADVKTESGKRDASPAPAEAIDEFVSGKSKKDKKKGKKRQSLAWDDEPAPESQQDDVQESASLKTEGTKSILLDDAPYTDVGDSNVHHQEPTKEEDHKLRGTVLAGAALTGAALTGAAFAHHDHDTKTTEESPVQKALDGFGAGFTAEQLEAARQMRDDFGSGAMRSKKEKKRDETSKKGKKSRSTSRTPQTEFEPQSSSYFDESQRYAEPQQLSELERVSTPQREASPSQRAPDGFASGFTAEQLELARQMKEDFASGAMKSKKELKQDKKKRTSLLRTVTDDNIGRAAEENKPESSSEMNSPSDSGTSTPNLREELDEFSFTPKKGKKGKKRQSSLLRASTLEMDPGTDDPPAASQEVETAVVDPDDEIRGRDIESKPETTEVPDEDFAYSTEKSKKDEKGKKRQSSAFDDEPKKTPVPDMIEDDKVPTDEVRGREISSKPEASEALEDESAYTVKKSKKDKKSKKRQSSAWDDEPKIVGASEVLDEDPETHQIDRDTSRGVTDEPIETTRSAAEDFSQISAPSKPDDHLSPSVPEILPAVTDASKVPTESKTKSQEIPEPDEKLSVDKSAPIADDAADEEFSYSKKSKKDKKGKKRQSTGFDDVPPAALAPNPSQEPDPITYRDLDETQIVTAEPAEEEFYTLKKSKKDKKGKKRQSTSATPLEEVLPAAVMGGELTETPYVSEKVATGRSLADQIWDSVISTEKEPAPLHAAEEEPAPVDEDDGWGLTSAKKSKTDKKKKGSSTSTPLEDTTVVKNAALDDEKEHQKTDLGQTVSRDLPIEDSAAGDDEWAGFTTGRKSKKDKKKGSSSATPVSETIEQESRPLHEPTTPETKFDKEVPTTWTDGAVASQHPLEKVGTGEDRRNPTPDAEASKPEVVENVKKSITSEPPLQVRSVEDPVYHENSPAAKEKEQFHAMEETSHSSAGKDAILAGIAGAAALTGAVLLSKDDDKNDPVSSSTSLSRSSSKKDRKSKSKSKNKSRTSDPDILDDELSIPTVEHSLPLERSQSGSDTHIFKEAPQDHEAPYHEAELREVSGKEIEQDRIPRELPQVRDDLIVEAPQIHETRKSSHPEEQVTRELPLEREPSREVPQIHEASITPESREHERRHRVHRDEDFSESLEGTPHPREASESQVFHEVHEHRGSEPRHRIHRDSDFSGVLEVEPEKRPRSSSRRRSIEDHHSRAPRDSSESRDGPDHGHKRGHEDVMDTALAVAGIAAASGIHEAVKDAPTPGKSYQSGGVVPDQQWNDLPDDLIRKPSKKSKKGKNKSRLAAWDVPTTEGSTIVEAPLSAIPTPEPILTLPEPEPTRAIHEEERDAKIEEPHKSVFPAPTWSFNKLDEESSRSIPSTPIEEYHARSSAREDDHHEYPSPERDIPPPPKTPENRSYDYLRGQDNRWSSPAPLAVVPEEDSLTTGRFVSPEPRFRGHDPDTVNRDSGLGTGSPIPAHRVRLDEHENVRDSGVHMREWDSSPKKERKEKDDRSREGGGMIHTDEALTRLSWPVVDEDKETVDLDRKHREKDRSLPKEHSSKGHALEGAAALAGLGVALKGARSVSDGSHEKEGGKTSHGDRRSSDKYDERELTRAKGGERRSSDKSPEHDEKVHSDRRGLEHHDGREIDKRPRTERRSSDKYDEKVRGPRRSISPTLPRLNTPDHGAGVNRPISVGSNRSAASATPPLRRSTRQLSGDLRSLSQRSQANLKDATTKDVSPATSIVNTGPVVANEGRVRSKDMTDIYDGFGEGRMGSPMSPTRPHSMRRRQSMQVLDLEARLKELTEENRALAEAKAFAENSLHTARGATGVLAAREAEVDKLKQTIDYLHREVEKLKEVNDGLTSANITLGQQHNQRYDALASQHDQATRDLDDVRTAHGSLSAGMESIVRNEVDAATQEKDKEIEQLKEEIEATKEQVRNMQREILALKAKDTDYLTLRDEDYFDTACQQLCQHVQQWVLRFSKLSDMRACRLTSEINNNKIIDRLDNAVLDGSDVDSYLADRIRRRDIFMSMTMTMIWEFVFTRYLFGMDRDQRQKLKALEKSLIDVGPRHAVHAWRAITLTLLARRPSFAAQRDQDTEAVVQLIFQTLSEILPPPSNVEEQIQEQLRRVMNAAVQLSIEMRCQRAEYMMLPPLQPEYDAAGELAQEVHFNAALMNERSGDTGDNEELQRRNAVVRVVLFPLVVKRGDDEGRGEEEIVVCPAQVLIAKPKQQTTGKSGGGGSRAVSAEQDHHVMNLSGNHSRVSMQSAMPNEKQVHDI